MKQVTCLFPSNLLSAVKNHYCIFFQGYLIKVNDKSSTTVLSVVSGPLPGSNSYIRFPSQQAFSFQFHCSLYLRKRWTACTRSQPTHRACPRNMPAGLSTSCTEDWHHLTNAPSHFPSLFACSYFWISWLKLVPSGHLHRTAHTRTL